VEAIGDGAGGINKPGADYGADDLHALRIADTDAVSESDGKGKARSVRRGQENSAFLHEGLEMFHAIPAEAGPHVIRRIILADEVRSFGRVLPREWIPPGARKAIDDEGRAREKTDGRKKNDVVF